MKKLSWSFFGFIALIAVTVFAGISDTVYAGGPTGSGGGKGGRPGRPCMMIKKEDVCAQYGYGPNDISRTTEEGVMCCPGNPKMG